jgi:hypothetical protein
MAKAHCAAVLSADLQASPDPPAPRSQGGRWCAPMERRMTLWNRDHALAPRHPGAAGYPDFAALAIVTAAPAILLLRLVPLSVFLPALSIVSFTVAGIAALVAHGSGTDRRAPGVTAWDVAAAFTAIWILAGLTSGARPFAELFERLAMNP